MIREQRHRLALLGPALVAAAAYVDPGNVASNTAAGARYGYLLVWVVVAANLMAGLVQYLSAKLGVLTGRSLPEVLAGRLPRAGRYAYWAQAEDSRHWGYRNCYDHDFRRELRQAKQGQHHQYCSTDKERAGAVQ